MICEIKKSDGLKGRYRPQGDKSLSHRAALFAALAEGESCIERFLVSGVTTSMLDALHLLGVKWSISDKNVLRINGKGLRSFSSPEQEINCRNSATTFRLLAGAIAGAGIRCTLTGSEGLRRRPMARITEPLLKMGAGLETAEGDKAPLKFSGGTLHGIEFAQHVASAQVKSCMILAAMFADSPSVFTEPGPSRDHTERMLCSMGAEIDTDVATHTVRVNPQTKPLRPLKTELAGDISSAAFLIVAACIVPNSQFTLEKVGINSTRTGLIDALLQMGANITLSNRSEMAGEEIADIVICHAPLHGIEISGDLVVRMIDEFPVFTIAAAMASGTTVVRDAEELRHKESDRISIMTEELQRLGADITETPDGFAITGKALHGGTVFSHGDHRVAMSLALTGLVVDEPVKVNDAEIINESFPDFLTVLRESGAEIQVS